MTTHQGIVRWYKPGLGFGFIAVPASVKAEFGIPVDRDLFVHAEGINGYPKDLQPDQRVAFEIERADRGPRAINVRVTSSPARRLNHVTD